MKIKKAIIPVGGYGTRSLPATKSLPKVMLPIVDKPAIHYLVDEAVASGVEEIIIVTGQNEQPVKNYFSKSKELETHLAKTGQLELLELIQKIPEVANIIFVKQKKQLGLGHAIYCARKLIGNGEMFAVMLGDDIVQAKKPCLAQLVEVFIQHQANVIGVQDVPNQEVSNYGIVNGNNVTGRLIKVVDLVEKPPKTNPPSNMAIMGRYIIHSEIFAILGNTRPGRGGEIQLTDALRELSISQELYAFVFEGRRYDLGDKLSYLKANIEFALQKKDISQDLIEYLNSVCIKNPVN